MFYLKQEYEMFFGFHIAAGGLDEDSPFLFVVHFEAVFRHFIY